MIRRQRLTEKEQSFDKIGSHIFKSKRNLITAKTLILCNSIFNIFFISKLPLHPLYILYITEPYWLIQINKNRSRYIVYNKQEKR